MHAAYGVFYIASPCVDEAGLRVGLERRAGQYSPFWTWRAVPACTMPLSVQAIRPLRLSRREAAGVRTVASEGANVDSMRNSLQAATRNPCHVTKDGACEIG
jgi:hypothetical protein